MLFICADVSTERVSFAVVTCRQSLLRLEQKAKALAEKAAAKTSGGEDIITQIASR